MKSRRQVIIILGAMPHEVEAMVASNTLVPKSSLVQKIILHPIADTRYDDSTLQIQYEIGTELGVATLLAKAILAKVVLHISGAELDFATNVLKRFSSFDFGYISSESSLSEEELENIVQDCEEAQKCCIFLGNAFAYHKDKELIYEVVRLLSKVADIPIIANNNALDMPDLAFLDRLESSLEDLPESNGAFVYFTPNALDIGDYRIYATKQFLALAKSKNGDKITLKNQNMPYENISYEVVEVPYLRGVVGVAQGVSQSASMDFYPFNTLQSVRI
ncbi:hypothetical protein [Helicobacter macacae]|uniref:Uncharacterized protein n=1 Tax=Helicobacter macacae MIT 99-5501 TaxID=1357400 RepID=V8CBP1_9HELI|nr:hypothetical protein [Helicobacter macacae]ETD24146.1 hypothetical protein HMPREF2086_00894 [Helicobacter macacae MIT 99-5501]